MISLDFKFYGASIVRTSEYQIEIQGVSSSGTEYTVMPDRNEEVTFAIAAVVTKGDLTIKILNGKI